MSENKQSIRDGLKADRRSRDITGHDLMDIARFSKDTRHMIIFGVIKCECPVGDKGERVRIFLTDEGYTKALQSQERGEMKIIRHARVRRSELYVDAPEHDNEI